MKIIPSAGTPIDLNDLIRGLTDSRGVFNFERILKRYIGVKNVFALCSGTASFFVLLKIFHDRKPDRDEVIIPAYTAPVLYLPIKSLGLKIRLVEVSLTTFNMYVDEIEEAVSEKTLCIVPVHLFGIPTEMDRISRIAEKRDILILEDAAQSLGSKIAGRMTGSFGMGSICSLHRGKNISTYSGGFIATDYDDLAFEVKKFVNQLPAHGPLSGLINALKVFLVAIFVRPFWYGTFYFMITHFKSIDLHTSFDLSRYSEFQGAVGASLMEKMELFSEVRKKNGTFLLDSLSNFRKVVVPEIDSHMHVAFNQFPLLVKDKAKIEQLRNELWKEGIETSRMYLKPMHHHFELGYNKKLFPNATFMAEHLVLLPTHPFVGERDLQKMTRIIRKTL
ncbi:MAG: DegT/DnrJ/EryC1/StrS family aminotransferase [Fidelibacterota bacterium]